MRRGGDEGEGSDGGVMQCLCTVCPINYPLL